MQMIRVAKHVEAQETRLKESKKDLKKENHFGDLDEASYVAYAEMKKMRNIYLVVTAEHAIAITKNKIRPRKDYKMAWKCGDLELENLHAVNVEEKKKDHLMVIAWPVIESLLMKEEKEINCLKNSWKKNVRKLALDIKTVIQIKLRSWQERQSLRPLSQEY